MFLSFFLACQRKHKQEEECTRKRTDVKIFTMNNFFPITNKSLRGKYDISRDREWSAVLTLLISILSPFHPLIPDITMHILITDLHTFLTELVRRIGLNIKTSHPW